MIIAKVRVHSVSAELVQRSPIPLGAAGCQVEFDFADPRWKDLTKTAVFRNGSKTLDAVLVNDRATIPHELLRKVKDTLFVGVYGTDAHRQIEIPTIWAKLGEIDSAANPSGDPATQPTLPYWAQVMEEVEQVRRDMAGPEELAAALEQAKESGEFDGPKGDAPVRGVDYWTEEDREAIVTDTLTAVRKNLMGSSDIVCRESGSEIVLTDASNRELAELCILGKTTQNGTPEPASPVAMEGIGGDGDLTVFVGVTGEDEKQQLVLQTPNGLPGVPVADGGNYTDGNGQAWVCDEIDLARGVYIKRVGIYNSSASTKWYPNGGTTNYIGSVNLHVFINLGSALDKKRKGVLCNRFVYDSGAGSGNETKPNVLRNFIGQATVAFDIDKTIAGNMEQWEAFAAQNPLTIQYVLATPQETALPAGTVAAFAGLHTYKTNTTITNDGGADMAVSYVADTKTYIDQKLLELMNMPDGSTDNTGEDEIPNTMNPAELPDDMGGLVFPDDFVEILEPELDTL